MSRNRAKPRKSKPALSISAQTARERNHIILRLRGMYASFNAMSISNLPVFTESEIKLGQGLIDNVLSRLGAEPESDRQNLTYLELRRKSGAI
jgi:hypothetical protein